MPPFPPFSEVPVNRFLGLSLLGRGDGWAELRLPVRTEFLEETGNGQGGILSSLADTAAVYAVAPDLGPGRSLTGSHFKLNFLRPGRPDEGDLRARAEALRRGRRLAVVRVAIHQGERELARGLFTFLVLEEG